MKQHPVPAIAPGAVEITRDRTATTDTFQNPDGSRTLRVYSDQQNIRQADGSWTPADLNLAAGSDGRFWPRTAPLSISFARTADDPALASVWFGKQRSLSYALAGAAGVRGSASGNTVHYLSALSQVDLRESATRAGVQEDIVLRSPQAASSYVFTLRMTGLLPILRGGDVELADTSGKVRAIIPAASMIDSKNIPHTGTGPWSGGVRYTLAKAGPGRWRLGLHLDTAWLDDPARAYPVTIDPSAITINTDGDDTYVESGTTSDHSGEPDLVAGSPDGGRTIARAYLHFGNALNALRNDYIVGASVVLDNVLSQGSRPLTLFAVTQPWSGKQVFPGAAAGQALDTETYDSAGCSGTWQCFSIPPQTATDWTHGSALADGLTLRAANESDSSAFKRYASANSANPPYLDVRYSPDGAAYQVSSVLLPTANQQGNVVATVTNEGSSTWPAGGGFRLGYVVNQNGTVVSTSQGVAPSTAVGPGQSATITVPLTALTPGAYDVDLTMWTPGGQDFHAIYGVPYGDVPIHVSNVAPTSDRQEPGSGAIVQTLTPTLYAHGVDPDNWPGQGLTYQFLICTDQNLTQNCTTSSWGPPTWAPPAGTLSWSQTYYWGVRVDDTVDPTPCSIGPSCAVGPLALTTEVPQPEITSHLASTPSTGQAPGLDPEVGNYTTAATDASVPTAGPDLTITRTYNSLDPRRDSAFGIGWSSRLDMRLVPDQLNGQVQYVLVTYPDGQQIRFGRNPGGTFAPPPGENVDLAYDSSTGIYTLRDASGTRWRFDVLGRLAEIIDPAGLTEHLAYDSNDHVTTITNDVSHRTLTFTWTGSHVTSITEPAPDGSSPSPVWTYSYDGDDLTQVCAPGAGTSCTAYSYTTGSHYRSSVLDDHPAAYYRLDETSGSTFASAVAREPGEDSATQNGVTLGGTGALAGTSDQAATFDGSSSYVTLPDGLVNPTMSLAVELWFKTTASGTLLSYSDQAFPPSGPPDARNTPLLYVGVDGQLYGGFAADTNGGPRQIVTQTPVNDGQWHHVVLTGSISTQSMYLDGVAQGSISGLIDQAAMTKMVLGAGYTQGWPSTNGAGFYFNGSIDELAVYQHPLSEFAIDEHYAAGQAEDELTDVHQAQDGRLAAHLTYDNINDRVRTLTDQDGLVWTLDPPAQMDAARTVVLHGPYPDWTYTYDTDHGGRLTSVSHLGHTRSYTYNTAGFLASVTDEDGNITTQTTDARGNVLSRTTCRSSTDCDTTYYAYVQSSDPLDPRRDKLASISDARSSGPGDSSYRTSYSYDSAGRLTGATYPIPAGQSANPQATWTYATGTEAAIGGGTVPAGELVSYTSRRGLITHYSYYSSGDLAQVLTPAGLLTQYHYDGLGRLISKTTGNGGGRTFASYTYSYTPLSQVAQVSGPAVTNPITGVTHTQVTSYSYDADGNLLSQAVSDATPAAGGGDAARTTTYTYDAHGRMASVTFPDRARQAYSYSADMLTQTTTDTRGTAWTYQYDDQHRLIAMTASGPGVDPQNPSSTGLGLATWSYDPAGRLARVTDAMGRATDYTYYGDGLLATTTAESVQQPDGSTRNVVTGQRSYDPAGNLTTDITAGGITTINTYDAAGYLADSVSGAGGVDRDTSYLRDADGNPIQVSLTSSHDPARIEVTSYTYAPGNQVASQSVSLGGGASLTTSFGYDERGLRTSLTDPRQITTHYTYDANGNLSQVLNPLTDVWTAGTEQHNVAGTSTLGYNTFGEVTQSEDPAGNITSSTRDAMGRVVSQTLPPYTPPGGQPITATTTVQYDQAGDPVTITDPLGRVSTDTYDPYGRLTSTTLPQTGSTASVLSFGYDRDGELLQQTGPTGAQTRYTYDALGRQLTSTQVERYPGPLAYYTTTTDYNDAGDPVAVHTPQGFTTTSSYDSAGELTSTTTPTGATTSYTYDDAGRQATVTDPAGLVTGTSYDLAGRPVKFTESANGQVLRTATATYDPDGDLASATSPAGRTIGYGYDAMDRLATQTEQVDPNHSITTTTGYDALGNPSHVVDGNGNATDYTYNSWDLPESRIEPATPDASSLADRTWTTGYDADGEPVTVTEPGGIVQSTSYSALGLPTSQTATGVSTTPRTLGYDADGRITSVGGPGGTTSYSYDDRGDLLSSQGPEGNASYTYNGDGTLAARTGAAGSASFQYNADDQLTSVADPVTGRTIDYGYNPAGQLTNIADSAVASRISRTINYDALGQVSSDDLLQYFTTGVPPRTLLGDSYRYDQDGFITGKTTTVNGAPTANSYSYDGLGRLTAWTSGSTTTNYSWDNAGNRTSAGGQSYTYNARNELVSGAGASYTYTPRGTLSSVTANGNTTQAGFDGFDRMTSNGASSYAYDSLDRVAGSGSSTFSYDGLSNNVVTDGAQTFSYLPDGTPLAYKATSASGSGQLLYSDLHGDVTGSYLGALVGGARAYDPFGTALSATGQAPDLGYQGGWTDSSAGTVNMAARWFTPATAQFTAQDSANVTGPPSTSTNRYTYADASPLSATDPSGHYSCPDGWLNCILCLIGADCGGGGSGGGNSCSSFLGCAGCTITGTCGGGSCDPSSLASCGSGGNGDNCGAILASYPSSCGGDTGGGGGGGASGQLGGSIHGGGGGSGGGHGHGGHKPGGGSGGGAVAPPPPPRWLTEAMTPQPRPPAGSTVTNVRPPAINLDQNGQIPMTDPGPGLTAAATSVTVAPVSSDPSITSGQGTPSTCTAAFNPAAGGSSCGNNEQNSEVIPGVPTTGCLPLSGEAYSCPNGIVFPPNDPTVHTNSWLDNFQLSLNMFGILPYLGTPANGLNAVIYGARGQWGNAASSAVGAIPFGKFVGPLGKLFGLGDKVAGEAGGLSNFLGDSARLCDTNSFTGKTPVTLANGSKKPIDKVKPGDKVLASDPQTNQTATEPVLRVLVHSGPHTMVRIRLSTAAVIRATDHHLFWDVSTGAFTYASDLHAGDRLQEPGGRQVTVTGLDRYRRNVTAYNLTIAGIHTYYAGSTPVLVHNMCPPAGGPESESPRFPIVHGPAPGQSLEEWGYDLMRQLGNPANPYGGTRNDMLNEVRSPKDNLWYWISQLLHPPHA